MHHETSRRFCSNFYGELKTSDMVNNSIVSQHLDAVIFLNEINTRQASSITTG